MTAFLEWWLARDIAMFAQGWTIELLMLFYRVWHVAPFAFVIFYAGLQTVNQDTLESAIVDGASRFERLRYVIVPHLMPLIIFISLIHLMDAYRAFEEIIGFSSQAHRISLQFLTYDFLVPDDSGNRSISRASASAMLTMVGIIILLIPLIMRTWRDHKGGQAMSTPKNALRQPLALRLELSRFPHLLVPARRLSAVLDLGDELQDPGGQLFRANPLSVVFGPATRAAGKGLSIVDIAIGALPLVARQRLATRWLPKAVQTTRRTA